MLNLTPVPLPPSPQRKTQNQKKNQFSAYVKRRTDVGELEKIIEFTDSATVY